MMITTRELHGI